MTNHSRTLETQFGTLKYNFHDKRVWWAELPVWDNLPALIRAGKLEWHSSDGYLIEPHVVS